jgi:hypothetical protein
MGQVIRGWDIRGCVASFLGNGVPNNYQESFGDWGACKCIAG